MEDKNFILEFVEVYRSLPALWNAKSKEYSNRNIKNEQYEVLLTKYKEKYPDATKKEVCQKINCLRTGYRRELKRISALEKSDSGLSEENDATLYYFHALEFLRDGEEHYSSRSSMLLENNTESSMPCMKNRSSSQNCKRKELMQTAAGHIDNFSKKGERDEADIYAEAWACSYRKLSLEQKLFAKKTQTPSSQYTIQRHPAAEDLNEDDEGSSSAILDTSSQQTPILRAGCKRKRKINDDISEESQWDQSDRYDLMGKTIAAKLRDLAKPVANVTEKRINDLLFEAEMGDQRPLSRSQSPDPDPKSTSSFLIIKEETSIGSIE